MEIIILLAAMTVVGLVIGALAGLIWEDHRPIGVQGDYLVSVIVAVVVGLIDWYVIPAMGFSSTWKFLGVALRVITLPPPPEVHFWDYSQARFLFDLGYQIARRSLEVEPLHFKPAWQARLRKNLTSAFRNILGASN